MPIENGNMIVISCWKIPNWNEFWLLCTASFPLRYPVHSHSGTRQCRLKKQQCLKQKRHKLFIIWEILISFYMQKTEKQQKRFCKWPCNSFVNILFHVQSVSNLLGRANKIFRVLQEVKAREHWSTVPEYGFQCKRKYHCKKEDWSTELLSKFSPLTSQMKSPDSKVTEIKLSPLHHLSCPRVHLLNLELRVHHLCSAQEGTETPRFYRRL